MLIILSSLVTTASGRLGQEGYVFTRNGGQATIRSFTQPTNPNSSDQLKIRGFFSIASKAWKDLNDGQRAGWTNVARSRGTVNRLGKNVKYNGLSLYLGCSTLRQAQSLAPSDTAPTQAPPTPFSEITGLSLQISSGQITLSALFPGNASNLKALIRITPPLASPAIQPKANDYRLIAGVDSDSFQTLVSTSENDFLFQRDDIRFFLSVGDRVGVAVSTVDQFGQESTILSEVRQVIGVA